jgi:hypothetical protein
VGTVLARYYDPSTGQFLTVDPKVATTLSPYGYVQGDPLNQTDAAGLSGGYGVPQNLVRHTAGPPGCFRNPFGGNNGNGGCETPFSTTEAGVALGIVGLIGSLGTLALPEGAGATAVGALSLGAGATGSGLDIGPCLLGNAEACAGAALGLGGTGLGIAAIFGLPALAIASIVVSGVGTAADFITWLIHQIEGSSVEVRSCVTP